MESVKISILLPTYNQCNFLKKSIKSVINQTFKNWELIVIDNKSIDGTKKFVKKISKTDKRIKYFSISNKGILAKSRNLGIRKSKGQWIAFIDSDDTWFPGKLEEVKNYINQTSGDLFYHDLVYENKKFIYKRKKILDKSKTINKPILKYFAINGNGIGQSSVVVKKKILEKVNYISDKKDKFSWEDFDTWIRISKKTEKFVRIPKILGSIWVGPENISSLERQVLNSKNIKKYYEKTFNKFLLNKDKKKKLWWLEYPLILKDFREKKIKECLDKIDIITTPPLKFCFIIKYIQLNLIIRKILSSFKKSLLKN